MHATAIFKDQDGVIADLQLAANADARAVGEKRGNPYQRNGRHSL
jgi:hypothetical protein